MYYTATYYAWIMKWMHFNAFILHHILCITKTNVLTKFQFFFSMFSKPCLSHLQYFFVIDLVEHSAVDLIGLQRHPVKHRQTELSLDGFLDLHSYTHDRKHMSTTSCQLHKHNICSLSDVELVCEQQAQIWTCPVHICEGTWGEMCEHETFDTVSINTLSLSYPDQCDFVDRISWS